MAFLTYRFSLNPTVPTSDTLKATGLTNEEIDGNFKSLDNAKYEKTGGTISGNVTLQQDCTIDGNLTVYGQTLFSSNNIAIEGKILALSDTPIKSGLTGTISGAAGPVGGVYSANITGVSTLVAIGETLTRVSGTGNFQSDAKVVSISGVAPSYTLVINSASSITNGSITFNTSGSNDFTADQAGINVKGTTDKSLLWDTSNGYWKFNNPIFSDKVNLTHGLISSSTFNTDTTTNAQTIDSTALTTCRSVKYFVQVTQGTSYHNTEINLIHDGSTSYKVEYGENKNSTSLGTFSSSIASSNLNLIFTPSSSGTVKVIKLIKTVISQ